MSRPLRKGIGNFGEESVMTLCRKHSLLLDTYRLLNIEKYVIYLTQIHA